MKKTKMLVALPEIAGSYNVRLLGTISAPGELVDFIAFRTLNKNDFQEFISDDINVLKGLSKDFCWVEDDIDIFENILQELNNQDLHKPVPDILMENLSYYAGHEVSTDNVVYLSK